MQLSKPLKKPSIIVFDWDNTLVNTWPVIYKSLYLTYEAFGLKPMSFEEVCANVKYSLRDSFPITFGDEWEKARDLFYQHFEEVHIRELAKLEGADGFLAGIAQKSLPMSLVSNKTGKYLRKEVTHLAWDHYFDHIIGAGDAVKDKPDVAPLIMAIEDIDQPLDERVWFVGDSEVDIKIAENAGCTGILLHHDKKPEDMNVIPHAIYPTYEKLSDKINEYF